MKRSVIVAPVIAVVLACARLGAQGAAPSATPSAPSLTRLAIVGVGDSTITLNVRPAPWLHPKLRGIVVDPRRNDVLVARFRVLSVAGDSAVALLTGLTSPVARQQVALVEAPRPHWYSTPLFWAGAALGAAAGVAAGLAF